MAQLSERIVCNYTDEQKDIMDTETRIILLDLEVLQKRNKMVFFENQEEIAYNVVSAFRDRKIINIMVVSKTQSGKTGSMCATIKRYLEDKNNIIPTENIYIITGLSSCEWKEQTKERMPRNLQNKVFHRCELPSAFADEIKHKKNILIIMDEIQVAARKGQTIYNTFKNAGLLDKNKLYQNDIKILEYTATPDGTIYDLMKWNDASYKILASVGSKYVGSYELLKMGRVKQYKDLCGYNKETKEIDEKTYDNIREIKLYIDKYKNPLYHIIRTKNGNDQTITIENFKCIFNNEKFNFSKFDEESDIIDINKILSVRPDKHTFIFIKEMMRCAKTLIKKFIGILYDRYNKNPDDTSVIQGLVGRDTGYDNNGISITFTNISSIERYDTMWKNNFEDITIKWKSKTTKFTNGILRSYNTFNNPQSYGFLNTDNGSIEPVIMKFKTQEQVKEYYIKELKPLVGGRGPIKRTPDENGFYVSTMGKGEDRAKIRTTKEIFEVRRWGLGSKWGFILQPCYEDINDKTSLEWWLMYYEHTKNVKHTKAVKTANK